MVATPEEYVHLESLLKRLITELHTAGAPGGGLIYTGQPWNPQMEIYRLHADQSKSQTSKRHGWLLSSPTYPAARRRHVPTAWERCSI